MQKINTGICQSRLQIGQPCYFVNWVQYDENKYEFFNTVYEMYKLKERLQKQQQPCTSTNVTQQ